MDGELVAEIVLKYVDVIATSVPLTIVAIGTLYRRDIVRTVSWVGQRLESQGGSVTGPGGLGIALNAPLRDELEDAVAEVTSGEARHTGREIESPEGNG
jgi:hypothetical protein